MMNNDGAFASPRSSANTAAIAISLQDLLSQPAKIFVVLPFHGVQVAQRPSARIFSRPHRQWSARCTPVFEGLVFNACQPNIDVRGDPAFLPVLRTALIESNLIRPGVAASIEQQAPCLSVIIFPAIGQDTFVPIQFKSFRVGVFPTTTPTVMCDL